MNTIHNNKNVVSVSVASPLSHNVSNDLLLHYRLGHVTFAKMKNISTLLVKFASKQPFFYGICPMARQTK